ncbi:MAG: ABC transporter substrate-binding protein [Candidatus Rokuibacteriota bacterium]
MKFLAAKFTVVKLAIFTIGLFAIPPTLEAQQAVKVYRIGMLETIAASLNSANLQAFRTALKTLGYVEGENLVIDYRSADGKTDRFPALAADLVRQRVDLIVTRGSPAAIAAKGATRVIPIVMAVSGDPVGTGIVSSLARPGGNVTGLSSVITELAGKRLELLREAVPALSRVALLYNPTNPAATNDWRQAEAAARALGLRPSSFEVRKAEDFRPAFETARKQRADVMVVIMDGLVQNHQREVVDLARRHRLPDIYASREFADAGGLMSYGVSYPDLYWRAASYVDKIFKGAKPADLPVEQPTKFELVVNLRTAGALGLTIPPSLLLRADQIIE